MTTFLLKTEPDDYSYADLARDGSTIWDGVANPTACQNMREAKPGDEAFIYHTGNEKRIAGLARITSAPYADPKRPDLTKTGAIKFVVFDIEPIAEATNELTLKDIKADERFDDFLLVKQGRLSALPVPRKLDTLLRKMAGLPA